MDDFCAEVLSPEGLLKYMGIKKEYFLEPEKTTKEYFGNSKYKEEIKTFGDFFYYYLAENENCYLYTFLEKGFTKSMKKLLESHNIDHKTLDIDWLGMETKEKKYKESLFDILYAMINYELKKYGLTMFGLNIGFNSALYFIVSEDAYKRINKDAELYTIFDAEYLETIYNEIFEVKRDLGVKDLQVGDFIEKDGKEYHSLFLKNNVVIKNIDEDNENEVVLIL
ncbi:hypothetical protein EII29_08430 [Leptotrichia sp. OH3620_COT-345]|nr:hypothetical protein EII29_08430 [Leptotrichia sp. OH3620_COT-345]